MPHWVCPGTSSWLSILGRVTNMMGNCRAAADAGIANGSRGFLTTDWGDMGHLQYLPVSEPGFAYAAAVSWCLDANADLDLAAALDVHAFDDPTGELGGALLALGDAHRGIAPQFPNISVLVLHLYYPQLQLDRGVSAGMTIEDLRSVEAGLADAVERLARARPQRADGALVLDELRTAAELVGLLCRDARAAPRPRRLAVVGAWSASVPSSLQISGPSSSTTASSGWPATARAAWTTAWLGWTTSSSATRPASPTGRGGASRGSNTSAGPHFVELGASRGALPHRPSARQLYGRQRRTTAVWLAVPSSVPSSAQRWTSPWP